MKRNEEAWIALWEILDETSDERELYVYRMGKNGKAIKPYLFKCIPYPELPEVLRDNFNGGDFRILIRERQKMIFSGEISIEQTLEDI